MKIKYFVYALLAIGLIALIGYRIKDNKAAEVMGNQKGPQQAVTVAGMVLKHQEF